MSVLADRIGDYVLGLLDDSARAEFEAAMAADPTIVTQVDAFAARLRELDDTATSASLPPDLWSRVEARLTTQQAQARPDRLRRLGLPRWPALAASIVVAGGLGFLGGQSLRAPAPAPVVVAVLISDAQVPGAIVEAFANNSIHIIPLEAIDVPEGKILEVWTKPNEEIGPVSLGRFLRSMEIVFPAVSLPTPQGGQLYEITLEDAPGSPTGKPTGPILFKGLGQIPV